MHLTICCCATFDSHCSMLYISVNSDIFGKSYFFFEALVLCFQTPSLCYMSCSPGTRLPRTSPPSVAPVHHVGHPSGQHIAMNKEVHLQARVHAIVACRFNQLSAGLEITEILLVGD